MTTSSSRRSTLGRVPCEERDGLASVRGDEDAVAGFLQDLLGQFAHADVVLGQEDGLVAAGHRTRRTGRRGSSPGRLATGKYTWNTLPRPGSL